MKELMVIYYCYINPFEADTPRTEKLGGWFSPAEAKKIQPKSDILSTDAGRFT